MKKIAFFPLDPNMSGSTMSMLSLILELKKMGIEAIVVLPSKGDAIEYMKKMDIKFFVSKYYSWCIPCNSGVLNYLKGYLKMFINILNINKIIKIVKNEKIDCIHSNNIYNYLPIVMAKKINIKSVWHIREFLEEDQNMQIINKQYAKKCLRNADRVVCISNSIYNKYSSLYDDKNMCVIYNGIDIEKYRSIENHALNNEYVNIMMPATIRKEKGQFELLYALNSLIEKGYSNVHVDFYGKGETRCVEDLKNEIINLNLSEYAYYKGYCSNITEKMKEYDIVCSCSVLEAFGRVSIESMLSKCITIGSNSGGTKELIIDEKTGFLYKQGSSSDLADVLIKVIKNKKLCDSIIENAHEYAINNFSAQSNAKNIKELYENL